MENMNKCRMELLKEGVVADNDDNKNRWGVVVESAEETCSRSNIDVVNVDNLVEPTKTTWRFQSDNPMDLDNLLVFILDHLSTKEVAKCRSVSKRWQTLATNIMLQRRDHIVKLTCYNAPEFTSIMESSSDIPYPSIRWKCWSLNNDVLSKLLEVVGGVLKVFVLDMDCNNSGPQDVRCSVGKKGDDVRDGLYFLKNILKVLGPTLEVVDFDEISTKLANPGCSNIIKEVETISSGFTANALKKIIFSAQDDPFLTNMWKNVFQVASNLVEVHINHSNQTIPIFAALERSGRLGQLRKLRLENIGQDQIDTMLHSTMTLEEFRLNVILNDVSPKKLEALLRKCSPTLRLLALGSPDNDYKIRIKLPKMPKLIDLGLFHCDDSLIVLEGLNIYEDMPKLRALAVSSACKDFDWKEYFSYTAETSPTQVLSVENLKLSFPVSDQDCCSYLGQVFPNLKQLSIEFPTPAFLEKVWTTWKDLTELYIYYNITASSTDEEFCGFGFRSAWKIPSKTILDFTSLSDVEQFLGKFEPPTMKLGISNMKNLQRLTIESNPLTPVHEFASALTDRSVYFGFCLLKDLRLLKIGRSTMSPIALAYLKRQLPMISTIDIRGIDGPGVFSPEESDELIGYIHHYNELDHYDDDFEDDDDDDYA